MPVLDDGLAGISQNGGFEQFREAEPLGWSKFGGEILLTEQAFHGRWAVALRSAGGSTKWIYQVVPVSPGAWYAASGFARMEIGAGEAFLRLSWYEGRDGDGTTIDLADSLAASSEEWAGLQVPAVQAPLNAHSVRIRLMLRASDPATAAFDDVVLRSISAPAPDPVAAGPTSAPAPAAVRTGAAPSPQVAPSAAPPPVLDGGLPPLRISEVLSNPEEAGRDSAFEWVELLNTTGTALSTAGWRLGDATQLDSLAPVVIPPHGYLVVASKSAVLPPSVLVVRVADGEIGAGLGNSGDALRLISPDGLLVDALSYGDNTTVFASPPNEPLEGQTLGIRDPEGESTAGNWAGTLRATPGAPNEFPIPTPAPKTGAPRKASTSDGSGPPLLAIDRGAHEASVVPSILLALAGGAGIFASVQLGSAALPRLRKKLTRDR